MCMNPIWPAYVILSKNGIYYTLYLSMFWFQMMRNCMYNGSEVISATPAYSGSHWTKWTFCHSQQNFLYIIQFFFIKKNKTRRVRNFFQNFLFSKNNFFCKSILPRDWNIWDMWLKYVVHVTLFKKDSTTPETTRDPPRRPLVQQDPRLCAFASEKHASVGWVSPGCSCI